MGGGREQRRRARWRAARPRGVLPAMHTETWILLRGLTREAAHWGEFPGALGRALPHAELLTLDLPGAGARLAEPWPGSVEDAMETVRAEARARASTTRWFVVGMSLGGMITMAWAARHPGELAGVAIGASSARDVAPPWRRMRPSALPSVLLGGLARDPARREARLVRVVTSHRDLWDQTTAAWTAIQQARPVSRATSRAQLRAALRWRAPAALQVPALVLVGLGDRLVHPDCSRALAARFGAPLVEHPTAGHDLSTDAGDWMVDALARWRGALPG